MSLKAIGSIPAKGSSRKMNCGLQARAGAISTRLRSPPERATARVSRTSPNANSSSRASRIDFRCDRESCTTSRTARMLSSTVSSAEDRWLLGQITDAKSGAAVHGQAGDVATVQIYASLVRRDQTGDHVEAGGFPGAVGPSSPTTSPRRSSRLTPLTTGLLPYRFPRFTANRPRSHADGRGRRGPRVIVSAAEALTSELPVIAKFATSI